MARTILVHLNIELPDDSKISVEKVVSDIETWVTDKRCVVALAEEI